MTTRDFNNWFMYYQIQKLREDGHSRAKIGSYLVMDPRTVKKYLEMTEEEFEQTLNQASTRSKILSPYETFVKDNLVEYPDTSTAQLHDWLKEHHDDLPDVSPRTVYNFVMFVRQKYNIPVVKVSREYFTVPELPYGEQAQVDFGQTNLRMSNGKRKKVYFFAIVLSRSRMKYIWCWDKAYTALDVCEAHDRAFAFYGGIPDTLVYDQDATMIVNENLGDIILTSTFKQYTKSRNFKLHVCRKSDPQSKGKTENVVKYVKKNFLYNRTYWDINTLNEEALGWLNRTANALVHNYTKKVPLEEFHIEKDHLNPFTPMIIENKENKMYYVRKTNAISYKSNHYSVPMGTYKGSDTKVIVKESSGQLEIYNSDHTLLCTHKLSSNKGEFISNTDHKRDTSKSIDEMMNLASSFFTDKEKATQYLQEIKKMYPRYIRDQLQVITKALQAHDRKSADRALAFCLKNDILNGHDFEQVIFVEAPPETPFKSVKLLDKNNLDKMNQMPDRSDLSDYDIFFN